MEDIKEFELIDDDFYAISIAMNIARRFLRSSEITPQQVIDLGNALFALERLPIVTSGSSCEFGILHSAGTEEFSKIVYIKFVISESEFRISQGGSIYDKAVGGDNYSSPGWEIEVDGYYNRECDLYSLEDIIVEYLNLGAKIEVYDESDIDYVYT
jgi:hypothetical protein